MKKSLLVLLIATAGLSNTASACSQITHSFDSAGTYSARTMDFCSDLKTSLAVYPRGIQQQSNHAGMKAIPWVSKYGYVSVNQPNFDKNLASDGVNEKGLAIHMLYMGETKQALIDKTKPVMDSYTWVHYVLGNFDNVEDVLASMKDYQIHTFPISIGGKSVALPIHFAIEDKYGCSAVIEFVNGKLTVHKSINNSTMTNEPSYDAQLSHLKTVESAKQHYDIENLPGGGDSKNRFVRANYINTNLPNATNNATAVNYMFGAINSTAVPFFNGYQQLCSRIDDPVASISDAWPTQWMTVSDLSHETLYFTNTLVGNRVYINLNEVNLNAGQPVKQFDTSDTKVSGDVSKLIK